MDNGHGGVVLDDELVLRDYRTTLVKNNLLYLPSHIRRKLNISKFQRFSVSLRMENGEYVIVLKKLSKDVT